jgi:16S rRNA (cytosine967-C5)-methyltransferase
VGVSSPAGLASRKAAQTILIEVLHKRRPLDAALASLPGLPRSDAGFARAIASETLRRLGQLDAVVRSFVAQLPPPHRAGPTFEILLAGTCELLFLNVAAHATVDAANKLAQEDSRARHFKPLINAVLRRVAREGAALISTQDAPRLNTPDWLWARWTETFGLPLTQDIACAHLATPPVDIVLRSPEIEPTLVPEGRRILDDVVRLETSSRVEDLPGFNGAWWVQDVAASLPARLLGDVGDQTVLDLCAAPGGKTMQLASRGANVVCVERDAERIKRLRDNLERLHLKAIVVEDDVRDFVPPERASNVLLDAPCSATGTIRRHPDLPWIKNAADVQACASLTEELLASAADMTAVGGRLVYAVCSLEPEEGEEQIEAFLARHGEFAREPIDPAELPGVSEAITARGDLRTLPCHLSGRGGMDGFFVARLTRRS